MLENKLTPISSISGVICPAWAEGHRPTHTPAHRPFPLNSYFQQLSAWWGNQALDPRLKSYQLHLFLSPCYHSFLSSRRSFTNPLSSSLISLTPPEILGLSSLLYLSFLTYSPSCAPPFLIILFCSPLSSRSNPEHLEALGASFPLIMQDNFYLRSTFSIPPVTLSVVGEVLRSLVEVKVVKILF